MILLESAIERYSKMFRWSWTYRGKSPSELIALAARLKKQDRVVWLLKRFRIGAIIESSEERDPRLRSILTSEPEASDFAKMDSPLVAVMTEMLHLADTCDRVPSLRRFSWVGRSIEELRATIGAAERAWSDGSSNGAVPGAGEVLVTNPDRSQWFDLRTPSCDKEGSSMGHCGNSAAGRESDTLISLRFPTGRPDMWRPVLTFVLLGGANGRPGWLGEMKGRGNNKPASRYHPHIIALLRHPRVLGIAGGGYKPKNNFSLDDLPPAQRAELIAEKPGLGPIERVLKAYRAWDESLVERLGARVGAMEYNSHDRSASIYLGYASSIELVDHIPLRGVFERLGDVKKHLESIDTDVAAKFLSDDVDFRHKDVFMRWYAVDRARAGAALSSSIKHAFVERIEMEISKVFEKWKADPAVDLECRVERNGWLTIKSPMHLARWMEASGAVPEDLSEMLIVGLDWDVPDELDLSNVEPEMSAFVAHLASFIPEEYFRIDEGREPSAELSDHVRAVVERTVSECASIAERCEGEKGLDFKLATHAADSLQKILSLEIDLDYVYWNTVSGSYDAREKAILLQLGVKGLAMALKVRPDEVVSTWTELIVHELQHARQDAGGELEGARGGSPKYIGDYAERKHEIDAYARSAAGTLVKKFGSRVSSFTAWSKFELQQAYAASLSVRTYWWTRDGAPDIWRAFAARVQEYAR